MPILLILIFGMIDFGRAFNAWITVTNAAREGARVAATRQDAAAITSIIVVALSIYFIFKYAPRMMRYAGEAGLSALSKIMGFIVIGIGVQMIISSIASLAKSIYLEL